jgi:hypothetical protein
MVITLQDRETLKAIVREALALEPRPGHMEELLTKPVRQVTVQPAEKKRVTVQQLLDTVREYRAVLKKHDRVMDQYRDHPFDSKTASKAREKARDDLEQAEEGFLEFCKAVAAGTTVIERGT